MADVNANIGVGIDTSDALSQLKALQRQISQFHSSIAKSSEAAALAQRNLQKNFVNSINSIGAFSAELRTVRTSAETFTNSLEKNKFSMREYFRYSAGATKTFGKNFAAEFNTIEKVAVERVKTLQTQYVKLGRDAQGAMQAIAIRPQVLDMKDLGTQTAIAAQKQALFNQLVKQGSTNLLNFGKNTQWAGRQLMVGFTLPLVTLGTVAAKTFMEMEAQVIKFKKVYGDLFTPDAERAKALEEIQGLASAFTKYGIAASDTVGVAAEAAAAGFSGVDLQRQTEQSLRLSVLGQIDYQKSLETTISLQNSFRLSSADLATEIDFLNAVENQTVVSLDDITTAIPKVAPVIQSLGGDVKDLAFFMAAMKEGGINASEGANALKSGLASLINPSEKSAAFLASLGINLKGIVDSNPNDVKGVVIGFAQALDKLEPTKRAQAIEQLFGKFQFARLSTLFDNVIRDGTQASRVLDLAGASIDELASMSEKELGVTAESAMNKFLKTVEDLKIALAPIGEVFLEVVTPFVGIISDILERFNALPEGIKKAVAATVAIVGGLGPVILMTFGLLANGIANSIKFIAMLRNGYLGITGQTRVLGESTQYMTMEQLEASAAAASLNQSHSNLIQTFNVEAGAVNQLKVAYEQAMAAGMKFAAMNPNMMKPGFKPGAKFASGGTVGGSGNKDTVAAMLTPGEFVVKKSVAQKMLPFLEALNAGKLPGFNNGGLVGDEGAQKTIGQARNVAKLIDGLDDILMDALTKLGGSLTRAKVDKALLSDPALSLLSHSTAAKGGRKTGSQGMVKMHAGGSIPVENVSEIASLLSSKQQANVRGSTDTKLMNNMVFGGPAAANAGKLTGSEFGGFVQNYPETFMKFVAEQGDIPANHPDLIRFAENVKSQLLSAGDTAIGESQFEDIIGKALKEEIYDLAKQTSIEAKKAFDEAQKISTVKYMKDGVAFRAPLTAQGKGQQGMAGGQAFETISKDNRPYKQMQITKAEDAASDTMLLEIVKKRAAEAGYKVGEIFADTAATSLVTSAQVSSPSKKTKQATDGMVEGVEVGILNAKDDVAIASQELMQEVVTPITQSARGPRRANTGGENLVYDAKASGYKTESKMAAQEASRQIGLQRAFSAQLSSTIAKVGEFSNTAQKAGFAFSGVAGIMSMFGGTVGEIGGILFQLSLAFSALATVTSALTSAKIAEKATAIGANLFAMTKRGGGAGLAKGAGLMANIGGAVTSVIGPLGKLGSFLLRAVPFVGAALLAFEAFKFVGSIIEEQKKKITGLGDTAFLAAEKMKKAGELLGFTPAGGINLSAGVTQVKGVEGAQLSKAQEIQQSENFTTDFADNINAIKGATMAEAESALNSMIIQLIASGSSPEAAQALATAIATEAGKTDVNLSFGVKFDPTDASSLQSIATAAKANAASYKTAFEASYVEPQVVMTRGGAAQVGGGITNEMKTAAATLGGEVSTAITALKAGLDQGTISATEFQSQIAAITGDLSTLDPKALGLVLPTIAKNLGVEDQLKGLNDLESQLVVIEALLSGVEVPQETIDRMKELSKSTKPEDQAELLRIKEDMVEATNAEVKAAEAAAEAKQEELQVEIEAAEYREGLDDLDARIQALQNEATAYNILTQNGFSAAEATAAVADANFAAALAAAANSEEQAVLMDRYREMMALAAASPVARSGGGGAAKKSDYQEAVEGLQKQRDEIRNNIGAYNKLRAAGMGVKEAFEAASDPQIAAAIAKTTPGTKKWEDLIRLIKQTNDEAKKLEALELSIKVQTDFDGFLDDMTSKAMEYYDILERNIERNYRDRIKKEQKAIEAAEKQISDLQEDVAKKERTIELTYDRPIADLQEEASDLSNDLAIIDQKSKAITDKYDAQAKALEDVKKINQDIINQQKSQISLADALSQGDISAAAGLMQDMRGQSAAAAAGSIGGALDAARQSELAGVTGASGLNREQIEQRQFAISQQIYNLEEQKEVKIREIRNLQDQIYAIETGTLKAAQDRLAALELQKQAELDIIDAQKQKWEDANLAQDLANIKAGKYKDVLDMAKLLVGDVVKNWNDIKDRTVKLFIQEVVVPAGGGGSGGGGGGGSTKTTTTTTPAKKTTTNKYAGMSADAAERWIASDKKKAAATEASRDKAMANRARAKKYGGIVKKMAYGGIVGGTGMGDVVPAMLTPGEFVVNRASTKEFMPMLKAMNESKFPGLIRDMMMRPGDEYEIKPVFRDNIKISVPSPSRPNWKNLSGPSKMPRPTMPRNFDFGTNESPSIINSDNSSTVYNYSLSVNVKGGSEANPDAIANTVIRKIKQMDSQRLRAKVIN
jgi:TP901 family phage tail tape measure protein